LHIESANGLPVESANGLHIEIANGLHIESAESLKKQSEIRGISPISVRVPSPAKKKGKGMLHKIMKMTRLRPK